jgi:hypothetical protein
MFMVGRGVTGFADGRPELIGYAGIQILLGDYGRSLIPTSSDQEVR